MKAKTLSSLKKRLKITATGKYLRRKAGKSHLLSSKNRRRKRNLSRPTVVSKSFSKKFRALLPGT
jgi:large subunit ribosomal protein L35